MLAMAVFILLPYSQTNKYHMMAALVTLFSIWVLQCYKDTRKKWILAVAVLMAVYSFLFTDDRLLLLVFLAATVIVYFAILFFQDQDRRKYLYMVVFGGILAAGVLNFADIIIGKLLGQGTGISGVLGGYGGADYFNWIDVENFFFERNPIYYWFAVRSVEYSHSGWNDAVEIHLLVYQDCHCVPGSGCFV